MFLIFLIVEGNDHIAQSAWQIQISQLAFILLDW